MDRMKVEKMWAEAGFEHVRWMENAVVISDSYEALNCDEQKNDKVIIVYFDEGKPRFDAYVHSSLNVDYCLYFTNEMTEALIMTINLIKEEQNVKN